MLKMIFIPIILLGVSIFIGYIQINDSVMYDKNMNSEQIEIPDINKKRNVLTKDGKLNLLGWSRNPYNFEMNSANIKTSTSIISQLDFLRYKKWEFYLFTSKDFIFAFAAFDFSLVGGNFIHFADLNKKDSKIIKKDHIHLFDKPVIPDNCYENCKSILYKSESNLLKHYEVSKTNVTTHKLIYKFDDMESEILFDIEVILQPPTNKNGNNKRLDSMVGFYPISQDTSLFYHNTKTNTLVPRGMMKINGKVYNPEDFLVTMDEGRGVWPVQSFWLWGNGNGKTKDGNKIGLNFGHGFSHPEISKHTEDYFLIDGELFKLPALKSILPHNFEIANIENEGNLLIYNENKDGNHCNIQFKSLKKAEMNVKTLFFIGAKFILNYGVFFGTCTNSQGIIYKFDEVYGLIELNETIW